LQVAALNGLATGSKAKQVPNSGKFFYGLGMSKVRWNVSALLIFYSNAQGCPTMMLLQAVMDRMKGMQLTIQIITDMHLCQVWCACAARRAILS
jgi:hypothetical protein